MLKTFYIGVKGVITSNDKVLLMKKEDQDGKYFWDIPGGRMDDSETIKETLVREMKEEVPSIKGFEVGSLLSAYRLERDLKDGHGLTLLFYEIEAEDFDVVLSDEHTDFKWFSLEELNNFEDKETYINDGYLEVAKISLTN